MIRPGIGLLSVLLTIGTIPSGTGAAGGSPASSGGAGISPRERAIALYDEERYQEARAAFETLDAEGKADGAVLYRLSFCLADAGDLEGRDRAIARAVASLEKETREDGALEAWFYLANAYRNLGRAPDAARAAAEATQRVERGSWPAPERPVDLFRVAKLYGDQLRVSEAEAWYGRALAGFAKQPGTCPAYVRWARGFLGDLAVARMEWETAEREFQAVVAAGKPAARDWFRLAAARARLGRWEGAAEAWREAEKSDPAAGDDPRYARQIALQAQEIGSLPSFDADGRTWDLLSREDLERALLESAQVAQDAAASSADLAPAMREDLGKRLSEARRRFVAAGIEYAIRGFPLRETAFGAGYAPLVFHADRWRLPTPVAEGSPGP